MDETSLEMANRGSLRRHQMVYDQPARHPLAQRFHDLLAEMGRMHDKKQADYGRDHDPFANVRATEDWGHPAWVGAMIRATDKLKRLQKVAKGSSLSNEGAMDSMMDLAVYALIALVMYEEQHGVRYGQD